MNIEQLLDEEIQDEFGRLSTMELGTEEYKTTVDGLSRLIDKKIDLKKLELEREDKTETRKDEKMDRLIKNGISIGGILIPLGCGIWGTLKSLKFEETGTVTTLAGKGYLNKIIFWKK